ncbi:MAG: glycerate kinase type-2 family protein [Halodesulfurarchaeum sp.]
MIVNRSNLVDHGNAEQRELLLSIVEEALDRVQPDRLIPQHVSIDEGAVTVDGTAYDLKDVDDVYVFGAGKGSLATVEALTDVLGDLTTRAVAVEKRGQGTDVPGIDVFESGHPLPDVAGLRASEAVVEMLDAAGPDDLVFACITGGASAQLPYPVDWIPFEDLVETNEQLLQSGLPIEAINTVRKHLSAIKGGRLAGISHPARTISLIVVDEVGGRPWGPTVPDETTFEDAIGVLETRDLWETVPASVRSHLERGRTDPSLETPGPDEFATYRTQTVVVADASDLCEAARDSARERGVTSTILSTMIEGESVDIARAHAAIAKEIARYGRPIEPPCVLVSGGETTVSLGGTVGRGGPNQEFAVQFALEIEDWPSVAALSIGTDGTDGPTEFAGGLVDHETVARAESRSVDLAASLRGHDSTTALRGVDDAIRTGGTGTNLMDLRLFAVAQSSTEAGSKLGSDEQ